MRTLNILKFILPFTDIAIIEMTLLMLIYCFHVLKGRLLKIVHLKFTEVYVCIEKGEYGGGLSKHKIIQDFLS